METAVENSIESTVIGNSNSNGWQVPPELEESNSNSSLAPCPLCERKFMSDRLEKHITICQKLKEKKRKQFDSTKMRVENLDKINNCPTEIVLNQKHENNNNSHNKKVATKNGKKVAAEQKPAKTGSKSNWRTQHQEFIRTIRAARGETVEPADEDDQTTTNGVKAIPPGFVECPSCNRRFSDRAAERHLPWCADKQRNQQCQINNNKTNNHEAMERMKARTKYKPTNNLSAQTSVDRAQSRSRSSSTSSKRTVDKPTTTGPPASSKSIGSSSDRKTTIVNRKYTKNISKSTENIRHKVVGSTNSLNSLESRKKSSNSTNSVKSQQPSRANKRTDNNSSNTVDRNRTMLLRKNANYSSNSSNSYGSAGHYNMANVQSKVNTGLKSPNKNTIAAKKSDPVMKFKEKFPNHQQRNNSTQQYDFELLRRNSSEYDNSPKTVPGVRTGGGLSPVKSIAATGEKSSLAMSRSETNLNEIGGDIKKRIDMYINGLYDNELMNNYTNELIGENNFDKVNREAVVATVEADEILRQTTAKRHLSMDKLARDHSINSDDLNGNDARGSTSDSTDSGLGVIFTNGSINKDTLINGNNRDNVNNYPREIVSPPMSDVALERSSRLMMLNSSLNDLHLIGRKSIEYEEPSIQLDGYHHYPHQQLQSATPPAIAPDLPIPRFCHNCGTKYPNTLAKFCYECGNRRFGAIA